MILFCGFCDTHGTLVHDQDHRMDLGVLGHPEWTVTLHGVTLMVCECGVFPRREDSISLYKLISQHFHEGIKDYYNRGGWWSIYPAPEQAKKFVRGVKQE